MEDLKLKLAEAFRTARLRKGLTQETLAELVGVTTETVSNSERAESLMSLPIFLRTAAALDLDLTAIVGAPAAAPRKVASKRRRLEGELIRLAEQMSDAELDLWVGIGRLLRTKRDG